MFSKILFVALIGFLSISAFAQPAPTKFIYGMQYNEGLQWRSGVMFHVGAGFYNLNFLDVGQTTGLDVLVVRPFKLVDKLYGFVLLGPSGQMENQVFINEDTESGESYMTGSTGGGLSYEFSSGVDLALAFKFNSDLKENEYPDGYSAGLMFVITPR